MQRRALQAPGRAAAAGGAQYRSAARRGKAGISHRSRNARCRRARLPSADRARGARPDAGRAGAGDAGAARCGSASGASVARNSFRRRTDRGARFRQRERDARRRTMLSCSPYRPMPRRRWSAVSKCRTNFAPSSTRISGSSHRPVRRTILGVINGTVEWIFNFTGRVSVTISAGDRLLDTPREAAGEDNLGRGRQRHRLAAALPPWQIVRERRATFAATPAQDAKRPGREDPLAQSRSCRRLDRYRTARHHRRCDPFRTARRQNYCRQNRFQMQ